MLVICLKETYCHDDDRNNCYTYVYQHRKFSYPEMSEQLFSNTTKNSFIWMTNHINICFRSHYIISSNFCLQTNQNKIFSSNGFNDFILLTCLKLYPPNNKRYLHINVRKDKLCITHVDTCNKQTISLSCFINLWLCNKWPMK